MRDESVLVELLYFDGCPHYPAALDMVQRIASEEGVALDLTLVDVTAEVAQERRFLGSPSIRVDGVDVEPGAEERETFVFGCRVYRTDSGLDGLPDDRWVRTALCGTGDHRAALNELGGGRRH